VSKGGGERQKKNFRKKKKNKKEKQKKKKKDSAKKIKKNTRGLHAKNEEKEDVAAERIRPALARNNKSSTLGVGVRLGKRKPAHGNVADSRRKKAVCCERR